MVLKLSATKYCLDMPNICVLNFQLNGPVVNLLDSGDIMGLKTLMTDRNILPVLNDVKAI